MLQALDQSMVTVRVVVVVNSLCEQDVGGCSF